MYSSKDMQKARRSLSCCCGLLALILAPLIAVYVSGIVQGRQGMMLAAMLAGFGYTVFICDLKLLPVLRYVRFLKEMEKGLRRDMVCILESMDMQTQMQDGVRVHALHVRLAEDEDSRILYVNAGKVNMLPPMDARVRITGYGRHVVHCEVL